LTFLRALSAEIRGIRNPREVAAIIQSGSLRLEVLRISIAKFLISSVIFTIWSSDKNSLRIFNSLALKCL
jgi:hypothetical protein